MNAIPAGVPHSEIHGKQYGMCGITLSGKNAPVGMNVVCLDLQVSLIL